jgi:pimeloyl-ACP methyl ester carboxylesterase
MNLRKAFPILVGSALFLTALMPMHISAQTTTSPSIKNIVLVHGAWADGSSWSKVIPILEAKGFHVVSVQNPLTAGRDEVLESAVHLIDESK